VRPEVPVVRPSRTVAGDIWDHQRVPHADTSSTPGNEPAHDVLAAEAFAVPAPDPELSHPPVVLPADPTGIQEPHDVLAAEEFAMPAVKPHVEEARDRGATARRGALLAAALGALVGLIRLRRRRR
jgi:hypothetical protein